MNPPNTPDGLFPSAENVYTEFTITCTSNSELAGHYNVTIGGTGGNALYANPPLFVYPNDPTATPAMTTVRPIITSLTSNAGGPLGGFPITIFGTGFSNVASNNLVRALLVASGC